MIRSMKKALKQAYIAVFPDYPSALEKAVGRCATLLDVGCGSDSPIRNFSKKMECVGVDAFGPSIERSQKKGIHSRYVKGDVLDIDRLFPPKSFDCVLASDLIEHLERKEGERLLRKMERLAKKKVVVFTPNGFLRQEGFENNPWQVHKSGWSVSDMRKRGYKVIGINGWKPLRTEFAAFRFRPKYFWLIVSDITQIFVKRRPEKAFQLLCVKHVKDK
jgi:ubiquinone/menaquinone biosynthesis C-methylase UbiE